MPHLGEPNATFSPPMMAEGADGKRYFFGQIHGIYKIFLLHLHT